MSYCRKEGKDIIIFATEEDQTGPSTTELLPDNPNELDSSSQSAILPNGDINWDCPCLGNLPHGPCGEVFRDAFTCWAENKDSPESFAEECFENFSKWEDCLADNRDIYKSSRNDDDEKDESEETSISDKVDSDLKELEAASEPEISTPDYSNNNLNNASETKDFEKRSAIAAASIENPIN